MVRLRSCQAVLFALLVLSIVTGSGVVCFAQTRNLLNLGNQVIKLYDAGKYAEAVSIARKFAEATKSQFGEDDPKYATALNTLALLYDAQGQYIQSGQLYKDSLAIREKAFGPNHPDVATSLNNLAEHYRNQGRYAEAEPLYKRALAIDKKVNGPNHPDVATSLGNLATLYENQGKYALAEPLFKRSLAIREKTYGPNHSDVAFSLSNLAGLYQIQGHYKQAEQLFLRAHVIFKKTHGPEHPYVATVLNNLAELYRGQELYKDAETLYKRSLAINIKTHGSDHPKVATSLNNLALLYRMQGQYKKSEPLYKRALMIFEKVYGLDHPRAAASLNNLAAVYDAQGKYALAEPLFMRSLVIWEKKLGLDHPYVATGINNLANLYQKQKNWEKAYEAYKGGNAILIRRTLRQGRNLKRPQTGNVKRETSRSGWFFIGQAGTAYDLARQKPERASELKGEAFEAMQWAIEYEAADALVQMAARFGTDDTNLAKLVRVRQDLVRRWKQTDKKLIAAISASPKQRNESSVKFWRLALTKIEKNLVKIDNALTKYFPDYVLLANPRPLSIEKTKELLHADEVLLGFLFGEDSGMVFAVTKTMSHWATLALSKDQLRHLVQTLRCGLDVDSWRKKNSIRVCQKLLNSSFHLKDTKKGMPLPFNLFDAHQLHQKLLGPVRELIKGKKLLIVPSGALTSLPLQVLVGKKPKLALPQSYKGYRKVTWLGTQHAITTLPSVTSLKALRHTAKGGKAGKSFIGFGNPLLLGPKGTDRRAWANQECPKTLEQDYSISVISALQSLPGISSLFRGSLADVRILRHQKPLPETTDELCAVARSLNVSESDVILGENATETMIKALSKSAKLSNYRILHFATHGFVAGDMKGQAEPALLFTPPQKATVMDDGLLTASEVAQLRLDADWVVLSACNTASGDSIGAEAFSGLARAFFYAGARAILVSHWPANTKAAVALVTRAFQTIQKNPKIGRAEAMRRSMINLINDRSRSWNSHPFIWAPFVVIGEGGALQEMDKKPIQEE